jgi:hypothetical protein
MWRCPEPGQRIPDVRSISPPQQRTDVGRLVTGSRVRPGRPADPGQGLLLVENLGDHAPLRDRLEKRYSLVHKEYADGIRAAQANGTARADIDPDLKAVEVIAFLNGLETSWLLNPSLPVEDVAGAWRDSQVAQMTVGPSLRA